MPKRHIAKHCHRACAGLTSLRSYVTCRYPNANNKEDDVAIIARRCPFVPDDVGDTVANATRLEQLPASYDGLLSLGGDTDVFAFDADKAARLVITLALVDAYRGPGSEQNGGQQPRTDLSAQLRLMSSNGAVLQSWINERGLLQGSFKTGKLPLQVRRAQLPGVGHCMCVS